MRKAAAGVLLAALLIGAGSSCRRENRQNPRSPSQTGEQTGGPAAKTCGSGNATGGVTAVPPPPGETAADGDALVRHLEAEPGTLNLIITTDNYSFDVAQPYLVESLLDMDLESGDFKPLLAETWEVAPDNVTFTFHLRHNVTWHDGAPFTADDVIYTFDRIRDPKVDAAMWRSYIVDCESYQKLDDFTVVFKWKKPYFKALETIGGLPLVPKHVLNNGQNFNRHPYGRAPIGAGPYRFGEWKTGQEITLERYPGYWGPQPHFDRVVFKIITNRDVALQILKKGDLDVILDLRQMQWVMQTDAPDFIARFNKVRYDFPAYSYIGWNLRKPIFQDKRTRQALTMLLNREAMLKEIFYCLGTLANGTFYFKTPYADPDLKPWPYDPERAKKLLADAGWRDTDNDGILDQGGQPFSFEMSFAAEVTEWEQMAVIYQQDLQKVGIKMKIRKLEWAVFLENVEQWKFDACCMSWALESNPDAYQLWHSSQADILGGSNHVGFKSPEVDRLIELNRGEFDRAKRIQYCRQIDRILYDEQPYTFYISRQHLVAVDKRIHNVMPEPIRPCFYFNQWYVPKPLQRYRSSAGP